MAMEEKDIFFMLLYGFLPSFCCILEVFIETRFQDRKVCLKVPLLFSLWLKAV